MSWYYNGRWYHNHAEYERAQRQGDAENVRNTNRSLRQEAKRLRSESADLRQQQEKSQGNLREATRLNTRLQQKQREHEAIQQQLQRRQDEFETRTRRRERDLELEIRSVEQYADQKIEDLRSSTSQQIAEVQQEVGNLRQEMQEELNDVRAELQETSRQLDNKIKGVRNDLEAERNRRLEKETSRSKQSEMLVEWVSARLSQLEDIEPLGLAMEKARVRQSLDLAREKLKSSDREMALPIAETAFTNYQTVFLEIEDRIGKINGVAEHIQELTERLLSIANQEMLKTIFPREAEQIVMAVEALRARLQGWRTNRRWAVFDVERDKIVDLTHELLARALELEAMVPGLLNQLQAREERLKPAGEAVAAIAGVVDSFELSYANPDDVKSARLVRAHIGQACVDTYLELDGTYRIDAYGFDSAAQCGEAAPRLQRKLEDQWMITDGHIDPANRQTPVASASSTPETWQSVSADFERLNHSIAGVSRK